MAGPPVVPVPDHCAVHRVALLRHQRDDHSRRVGFERESRRQRHRLRWSRWASRTRPHPARPSTPRARRRWRWSGTDAAHAGHDRELDGRSRDSCGLDGRGRRSDLDRQQRRSRVDDRRGFDERRGRVGDRRWRNRSRFRRRPVLGRRDHDLRRHRRSLRRYGGRRLLGATAGASAATTAGPATIAVARHHEIERRETRQLLFERAQRIEPAARLAWRVGRRAVRGRSVGVNAGGRGMSLRSVDWRARRAASPTRSRACGDSDNQSLLRRARGASVGDSALVGVLGRLRARRPPNGLRWPTR